MSKKNFFQVKYLAILALLIASEVVLSRFLSISMWNLKLGFAFVPVVIAAMYFGPLAAGIVAALADFIGAILFPIGPYFPGFTLSQFLMGLTFGFFLYKKDGMPNIVISAIIAEMIISLFLSTYWVSVLYGTPFAALLPTRIGQAVFMTVIQIVIIPILKKKMPAAIHR